MNFLEKIWFEWKLFFKLIICVLFFGFLVYWVDFHRVLKVFEKVSWLFLLPAVFSSVLGNFVSSVRLWIVTGYWKPNFSLADTFYVYYVGIFFNNLLPTTVGGDISKIIKLTDETINFKKATFIVTLSRGFGFIALFYLAVVGAFPYFRVLERLQIVWLRYPLLIGGGLGIIFFLLGSVGLNYWEDFAVFEIVRKTLIIIEKNFNHVGFYLKMFTLSLVFHLSSGLLYWFLARSIGVSVSGSLLLVGLPLITIFSLIPSSFGGLGVREAGITVFFVAVGLPAAEAFSIALLARVISYANSLAGGLLYLVWE